MTIDFVIYYAMVPYYQWHSIVLFTIVRYYEFTIWRSRKENGFYESILWSVSRPLYIKRTFRCIINGYLDLSNVSVWAIYWRRIERSICVVASRCFGTYLVRIFK